MPDPTVGDESIVTLARAASTRPGDAARERLSAGARVGRYVVLERLGVGGMGVVYSAYDPELDRKVALKLLHARPPADESLGRARLLREAQALARLSHANVVAVHDVGTFEGRVFVAMEFVSGETLGRWLTARPRTRAEILAVLAQAGRGLSAAHAAGLVHRDFKPENVTVRDDGRVVVMDFGVARPAGAPLSGELGSRPPAEVSRTDEERTIDLTATGALIGTPAYMAPEQHLGLPVDARSDQFSFCVTLYEALYRERPFPGDSLAAVAYRVSQGVVREAPAASRVPARLRRAVLRGLSVDPAQRYPSMDALIDAVVRAARPRGRVAAAGASGAIGLVALLAGPAVAEQRRLEACRAKGEAIAAIWNDDARERVRAGLAGSGSPDADGAFGRVAPWLDAYASAWADARREACVAGDAGDEEAAGGEARRECMADRKDALAVLVEALGDGDPGLALRSVQAAVALPPVSACAAARASARDRREERRRPGRARGRAADPRPGPAGGRAGGGTRGGPRHEGAREFRERRLPRAARGGREVPRRVAVAATGS